MESTFHSKEVMVFISILFFSMHPMISLRLASAGTKTSSILNYESNGDTFFRLCSFLFSSVSRYLTSFLRLFFSLLRLRCSAYPPSKCCLFDDSPSSKPMISFFFLFDPSALFSCRGLLSLPSALSSFFSFFSSFSSTIYDDLFKFSYILSLL